MARVAEKTNTLCPVARSLDIVGDRWTVLILRELYMGTSRFDDFLIQTGATPQMLAGRLKALEADGLVERHPYCQKPLRHEYRLTDKGWAFHPVIYALRAWGETWCKDPNEELAMRFVHRACGHDVGLGNVCPQCGIEVQRKDLEARFSPQFATERKQRHNAAKRRTPRSPAAEK
jgi:DNA-binding HxlR family transcriptional regulator